MIVALAGFFAMLPTIKPTMKFALVASAIALPVSATSPLLKFPGTSSSNHFSQFAPPRGRLAEVGKDTASKSRDTGFKPWSRQLPTSKAKSVRDSHPAA